jgi:hypothetical protein
VVKIPTHLNLVKEWCGILLGNNKACQDSNPQLKTLKVMILDSFQLLSNQPMRCQFFIPKKRGKIKIA